MRPTQVVIINDASRARGGATGLALLAARLMRARGLPVTYLCGDGGEAPELAELGVRVVAGGGSGLLQRPALQAAREGISNPATAPLITGFLDEYDSPGTVYHVHGWAQILSPALFSALRTVAGRTLLHAHDMFLACPNGVYMDYRRHEVCRRTPLGPACLLTHCDKRSYVQKLWRVARQVALRRALGARRDWGAVLPIHPGMIPGLTRGGWPEDMLRVTRNPATPYSATRLTPEHQRGLAYVGRLEPDKGPLELARAARRAGMPLTLVGEGSLRARLEQEHPEVTITGWVARREIAGFLTGARALVMPSHHPEPFALVIPEALGSGLPVITAETALMAPELVQAGLGLAVDVFDPDALLGALVAMRDMPDGEVAAISHRAFARDPALGDTAEGWAEALLARYGEVLSRACPG